MYTNADRAAAAFNAALTAYDHPEAGRVPVPSAKAGRQVINAYAAATRHNPAEQSLHGRDHADELIGDFLCDLLHCTAQWDSWGALLRAHQARLEGDFLLSGVPEDMRPAVFAVGNVFRLASGYNLDPDTLLGRAVDNYEYETYTPHGE